MWVIIILGALVLVFARSMRVEVLASANRLSAEQAASVEKGAEAYVLSVIETAQGDAATILEAAAEQLPLGDPADPYGYFWLLKPDPDNEQYYSFGIQDEGAKVSVNAATSEELMKLPGLESAQEVADAIVDWRDEDSDVSGQGAESDYYQALPEPYAAKNAPFETPEELLLVKGVVPELLWAYDRNRNGVIDQTESTAGGMTSAFNSATSGARGIFPFITVHSIESNTDTTGQQKANVNTIAQDGGASVRQALQQAGLDQNRLDQIIQRAQQTRTFTSPLDFIAKVGLTADDAKKVLPHITTSTAKTTLGLMNINTAPAAVLYTLPGLEQADVEAMIQKRPVLEPATDTTSGGTTGGQSGQSGDGSTDPTDITWVLDALQQDKWSRIGARITGKSYQYSADIVAVSGDGRAFKRVRIVVDTRKSPPKIVYRKDLTNLGWPLPDQVREELRSGAGLQTTVSGSGGMGSGMRPSTGAR